MDKRPVSLLVFDLDGTLVDSSQDIAAAVNHALELFGLDTITVDEVLKAVGHGVDQLVANVLPSEYLHKKEEMIKMVRGYYSEHLYDYSRLYPDVIQTLTAFKDVSMAVLTNKPTEYADRVLRHFEIRDYFFSVIGGDDISLRKPSPFYLVKVMEEVGAPSFETVMIGDMPVDIETGKNAGTLTYAVYRGFSKKSDLAKALPDHLEKDLTSLQSFYFPRIS